MDPLRITDTRPEDWTYISEGGATIVFSYKGGGAPRFEGHVLRLRKIAISDSGEAAWRGNGNVEEEPDDPMIAFQRDVISQLVPQALLPELDVVLLDAQWLDALASLHNEDRPVERQKKDAIDKQRRKGILATDLISGETTIAVEIKPKWGFLPKAHHLSHETAPVKTSTCRFCMHTSLRLEEGDVPTEYCPMDLYSKDETRVKKAIHDLWTAWVRSDGSLNNLKIFVSGKMIRPSNHSYGVLSNLLTGNPSTSHMDLEEAFLSILLPLLLRSEVLDTISTMQRNLDPLDIEGLSKLCAISSLENASSGFASITTDPTWEDWHDFVVSYKSQYYTWDHANPDARNIKHYLMAYLLSSTFKDCSVILKIEQGGGSPSAHAVSIIDLDPKAMNRLSKWEELDRKIVERYKTSGRQKRCIDQSLL